ncbi:MAG TPA: ribbon-helix-helix protein, CopG family [Patescibacteria group bacterium]
MIRTQIYLPKDLYRDIDIAAKREKKAKAEIIRRAIKKGLGKKETGKDTGHALLKIAAMAKKYNWKGPKDLSKNIDKYLYEE